VWPLDEFGSVQSLLAAPIEDVAFSALAFARKNRQNGRIFCPGNLVSTFREHYSHSLRPGSAPVSPAESAAVLDILTEVFAWLKIERFIADDLNPTGGYGWCIVTRLGESIETRSDFSSYAKRSFLPKDVVLDEIAEVSGAPFLSGRYDEAVRSAFTRVEVATRSAAGFGNDKYGAPLMRAAFYAGNKDGTDRPGSLADPDIEFSEREGVAHLFAGAMQYIKNPLSHREVGIDDARVAASRILLANDLMRTLHAHVERKIVRASESN